MAYEYAFKDHLGNTRVLAEPAGAGVVQTSAYYPYGLQIADLGGGSSTNEELYNGKELTDAHGLNWYHYGARYYDVAIARWTTMDPADEFHSPYVYVGGDPVNLVDPDGRQAYFAQGTFQTPLQWTKPEMDRWTSALGQSGGGKVLPGSNQLVVCRSREKWRARPGPTAAKQNATSPLSVGRETTTS